MYIKPGKPQPHMNIKIGQSLQCSITMHITKVLSIPPELRSQIVSLHHKHPQRTLKLTFIYQTNKTAKNKQNQAFLALVAAMRSQIPCLTQAQQGLFNKDIHKTQLSLFQSAFKIVIFKSSPSEKGINFWSLTTYSFSYYYFMMHGSTTPAGTLGIHKKQKYKLAQLDLFIYNWKMMKDGDRQTQN